MGRLSLLGFLMKYSFTGSGDDGLAYGACLLASKIITKICQENA